MWFFFIMLYFLISNSRDTEKMNVSLLFTDNTTTSYFIVLGHHTVQNSPPVSQSYFNKRKKFSFLRGWVTLLRCPALIELTLGQIGEASSTER